MINAHRVKCAHPLFTIVALQRVSLFAARDPTRSPAAEESVFDPSISKVVGIAFVKYGSTADLRLAVGYSCLGHCSRCIDTDVHDLVGLVSECTADSKR